MSAKDAYHNAVKAALQKDGWIMPTHSFWNYSGMQANEVRSFVLFVSEIKSALPEKVRLINIC